MSEIDYEAEYHKLKTAIAAQEDLFERSLKLKARNEEIAKLEAQLRDCKKEDEEPEPKPESTKNVKGNRLIVVAEYHPSQKLFRIPDGVDLNDKSVVESWHVKWGTLHIGYVDGRLEKVFAMKQSATNRHK